MLEGFSPDKSSEFSPSFTQSYDNYELFSSLYFSDHIYLFIVRLPGQGDLERGKKI